MHIIKCGEAEFETLLPDSQITKNSTNSLQKKKEYSRFTALCFLLNYCIGAGILGLPMQYYNCGYIAGTILLIYFGILTYITQVYITDGIILAEAITIISQKYSISKQHLLSNIQQHISEIKLYNKIEYNPPSLSELIGLFAGRWWKLFYDICFSISTLIVLWSYCTLFGVSLTRNISINIYDINLQECLIANEDNSFYNLSNCRLLYSFYIFIFLIWIIIICLMEFAEQKLIQIIAAITRFAVIIIMILLCILLLFNSNWIYIDNTFVYDTNTNPVDSTSISSIQLSGITTMIAVAAYSYGNQFCLPDIIQPLSISDRNNRNKLNKLWLYSDIISMCLYIFSGITISMYFGDYTISPCTLLFKEFMGFRYTLKQPLWANILSWCIILFPAVDIASSFPLTAISLSNTLESIVINTLIRSKCINLKKRRNTKFIKIFLRIFLCIFAISLSLIEWNFELIVSISGSFKLLAVYGGPCVLKWKLNKLINNQNNKDWTSNKIWIILIALTALVAFIAVFVGFIQ